jgi:predicted transcriptional regulator
LTTKEQILKIVQELPEDATIEEAIDQLYLWLKIQKAEAQVRSGQVVSHEEARKRIAQWLKE